MKKTLWTILSILLVLAFGLTACGPAATPTPEKIVETVTVEKTVVQVVTATPQPKAKKSSKSSTGGQHPVNGKLQMPCLRLSKPNIPTFKSSRTPFPVAAVSAIE
jgi:hypothetical protein